MSEKKTGDAAGDGGIALVMITIDRSEQGKENYLAQTIGNMRRAKVFESDRLGYSALVFSTASMDHFLAAEDHENTFHKLDVPLVSAPRLSCENAGHALQLGGRKALEHGLSWVLFCEDDLDFCDDFIESVGRWLDDYGKNQLHRLYAFGCAYPQIMQAMDCGVSYWTYSYKSFYGTQCFAIRPDDAISLGTYIASNPIIRGVDNPNAYDLMFHDWMDANYPTSAFLASVPSFVQHIGRQSICTGLDNTHTFDSWPGREWSYKPLDKRFYDIRPPVRKRAFIVLGPESSGTRLFTSILIAGGCHGSVEHVQPMDDPDYDISPYDNVVWRQSVPHNGQDLDLQSLVDRLNRQGARAISVLSVRRDLDCNAKSQVAWGHAPDYETAKERIIKANIAIREAKANCCVDRYGVQFEGFLAKPEQSQSNLWETLKLPGGTPVKIDNANAKWRVEEGQSKPRILFVGDSPTVNTGFSLCTRKVCAHLHSSGWEVHVLGLSYFGDPHRYPYPIYPAVNPLDDSRDAYGCMRLPKLIHSIKPDVVVLLNDPWNVEAYLYQIRRFEEQAGINIRDTFKLIGWLAVDGKNTSALDFNYDLKSSGSTKWGRLDHVAVWTEFAKSELVRGGWNGPEIDVIPLGVDSSVFYRVDKMEARAKILPPSIDPSSFIIGVVGRNQYRKRLDLCIQYFAEWITENNIEDAYLYLHCAPTGDKGVDIRSLVNYYQINGKVILSQASLGLGAPEEQMRLTYCALDVLMTLAQGEGFCLPVLEAMACGTLTMGSDWSGLGSWAGDAMLKIPCTSTAMTAPYGGELYTIGGIADKKRTIEWLDSLYSYRVTPMHKTLQLAFDMAQRLTWENTTKSFELMIKDVLRPQIRGTKEQFDEWKTALKSRAAQKEVA